MTDYYKVSDVLGYILELEAEQDDPRAAEVISNVYKNVAGNVPTVIPENVIKAAWENNGKWTYCSCCGWLTETAMRTKYCPNCGALMTMEPRETK